ncbi:MAG: cob(I)yrinic acid a,c-diamide adenosyltransferase [Candidatus Thermoplasmatota archaeon]|nr:cob(I)yrinic acid a,c-diamide adenosyltransferase [Candidatus Thermoplasmatota archaeon]
MVRINRVHTGVGDGGETHMLDGSKVGKQHPRVRLYGTIDEVNSQIGMVRMELNRFPVPESREKQPRWAYAHSLADGALGRVQQELFDVGAECSCPPDGLPEQMSLISSAESNRLVSEMDSWLEDTEPLESFIMPTGSPPVATLHIARTVARRAERHACSLRETEGEGSIRDDVISYLNRLSDWLFVLSRWIALVTGEKEVLWTPLGKRQE